MSTFKEDLSKASASLSFAAQSLREALGAASTLQAMVILELIDPIAAVQQKLDMLRLAIQEQVAATPVEKPANAKRLVRDRPWHEYPVGTKVHSSIGGHWVRTYRGWRWMTGHTFPVPGADATGLCVELPG